MESGKEGGPEIRGISDVPLHHRHLSIIALAQGLMLLSLAVYRSDPFVLAPNNLLGAYIEACVILKVPRNVSDISIPTTLRAELPFKAEKEQEAGRFRNRCTGG